MWQKKNKIQPRKDGVIDDFSDWTLGFKEKDHFGWGCTPSQGLKSVEPSGSSTDNG